MRTLITSLMTFAVLGLRGMPHAGLCTDLSGEVRSLWLSHFRPAAQVMSWRVL